MKDLCIANICTTNYDFESGLEAFTSSRLIPQNKNPGLPPIGVRKALGQIAGKMLTQVARKDVQKAAGALQVFTGQDSRAEPATHAIHDLYKYDEVEAVLLINEKKVFNSISIRKQ